MILEQPSVRFEAIHSILSSDGNILTVSELCETAGVSRSGYYRWLSAAGAGKNGRHGTGMILNESWRHTAPEDTRKAHAASICPCCTGIRQW